jgi:hypothetical protein
VTRVHAPSHLSPRAPARGEGIRPTGQRGETLVETITTIAIMSIVVVGILAAVWTTTVVSDVSHRSSRADVEATSLAHVMLGLPHASASYASCETATQFVTDYQASSAKVGVFPATTGLVNTSAGTLTATNGDVATLTVQYLQNANPVLAAGATVATATFGSTCSTDVGAQRLTITVRSATTPAVTEVVSVTKRNDVCTSNPYAAQRPGYLNGQRC